MIEYILQSEQNFKNLIFVHKQTETDKELNK
jgi:hypothetical protein